jgi:hypothetical protein
MSIAGPVSLLRKPVRGVELLDRVNTMLAVKRDEAANQVSAIASKGTRLPSILL